MKNKLKIISAFIVITLAITSGIFFFGKNNKIEVSKDELPIYPLRGSFIINVENLNEIVGDCDYVFVAKVVEELETIYKDFVTIETETGDKEVGNPYTPYKIIITENIKGNLITDTEVDILKFGGVSQDKDAIYIFENDELLQVGKTYIISAYTQLDGSLLISGPNSNKLVNDNAKSRISSPIYKDYINAFENQVVRSGKPESSKSIYEDN